MALKEYEKKRDFRKTPEPRGKNRKSKKYLEFVIQKHDASRLHYDFRLEMEGVLKSWAVPKGPSLDPENKRLAQHVEDHPYDYRTFEGIIPEGNYGAGNVIVWDRGYYHHPEGTKNEPKEEELLKELGDGNLKIVMHGEKLKGEFALVKMKGRGENSWLLIKKKDKYASKEDITKQDESVISGKKVGEVSEEEGVHESPKKTGKSESKKTEKIEIPEGAKKKKMPSSVKPMLATLVDEPFDSPDWIYELKLDGYRAIAQIKDKKVSLYSRNGKSFNEKFSAVVEALDDMQDQDIIIDGEMVVLGNNGKPDFQLIQNYQKTGEGTIVYFVFDVLYYDGYDLTSVPLTKRKKLLKSVIQENEVIKYLTHIDDDGTAFFEAVSDEKMEGILAKKKDSRYETSKRTKNWQKIKTGMRQEAVIGGYTDPQGSRKYFGALLLGVYNGDKFEFIGTSGGGFKTDMMEDIYKQLKRIERKTPPFEEEPDTNGKAHWVTPKFICEIKFSEWTSDGKMRHPVFVGMREDKDPKDVRREVPETKTDNKPGEEKKETKKKKSKVVSGKVKVSNPDKVFFPDEGYTKSDLINYYEEISEFILPYLKDRPESMRRHPNGINGKDFFHKDVGDMPPDYVDTWSRYSESSDKEMTYIICNSKETLLYMVNLGCIEINPWFSKTKSPDQPDYSVIDLDPVDVTFDDVIEVAQAVKEVCDEADIPCYPKTSGSKGIHIFIPLKARYDYGISKDFAHLLGRIVNERLPDLTSLERSPSKRKKKVYLDYLQNNPGQTLAAPYSLRPKPGATASAPLEWSEVKKGLDMKQFNINTMAERLKDKGDIFKPVLGKGVNIKKALERLEKI